MSTGKTNLRNLRYGRAIPYGSSPYSSVSAARHLHSKRRRQPASAFPQPAIPSRSFADYAARLYAAVAT
jgi:hypothetical protein